MQGGSQRLGALVQRRADDPHLAAPQVAHLEADGVEEAIALAGVPPTLSCPSGQTATTEYSPSGGLGRTYWPAASATAAATACAWPGLARQSGRRSSTRAPATGCDPQVTRPLRLAPVRARVTLSGVWEVTATGARLAVGLAGGWAERVQAARDEDSP